MAILATRRRWLVTSWRAASESSCSRQRLASMYSCSGSRSGNFRISERYRDLGDQAQMAGDQLARGLGILMLPPALGEHVLLFRLQKRELPDLGKVSR